MSPTRAAGPIAKGTLTAAVPTITGTTKVGSTLTAKPGTWTSGTTFKYAWMRNGTTIKDATNATYKLVAADAATTITVKVTGTKTGYTTTSKWAAVWISDSGLMGFLMLPVLTVGNCSGRRWGIDN